MRLRKRPKGDLLRFPFPSSFIVLSSQLDHGNVAEFMDSSGVCICTAAPPADASPSPPSPSCSNSPDTATVDGPQISPIVDEYEDKTELQDTPHEEDRKTGMAVLLFRSTQEHRCIAVTAEHGLEGGAREDDGLCA